VASAQANSLTEDMTACNADEDRQDLARLRRTSVRKKTLTDEEILLQIGMFCSLCMN